MPNVNLVVVGDTKTPKDWALPGVHFLDVERQKRLGLRLHDSLPYRHYARKSIGYLFATMNGARTVYETDDDNELLGGFETFDLALEPTEMWELVDTRTADGKIEDFSRNVCNPCAPIHRGAADRPDIPTSDSPPSGRVASRCRTSPTSPARAIAAGRSTTRSSRASPTATRTWMRSSASRARIGPRTSASSLPTMPPPSPFHSA